MHTPPVSAFDIDPNRIIEKLNKLPPFDFTDMGKLQPAIGDIEQLKIQLAASMDNAALNERKKP